MYLVTSHNPYHCAAAVVTERFSQRGHGSEVPNRYRLLLLWVARCGATNYYSEPYALGKVLDLHVGVKHDANFVTANITHINTHTYNVNLTHIYLCAKTRLHTIYTWDNDTYLLHICTNSKWMAHSGFTSFLP